VWSSKPAAVDRNLLFKINTVRPENPWKKPKTRIGAISSLTWPFKTANGLSRTPLRNQTLCATNREKTSAFTLYQTRKTTSPSLTKTRQKTTLHLFSCRRPPRREERLFINRNYHSLLGRREAEGSPPPFSCSKKSFLTVEKIAGAESFFLR